MKWRMKLGRLHARYHTCKRTRAGLNGISTSLGAVFSQSIIFSTSFSVIWKPSQLRIADSSRYRIEYGNLSEMERINELQIVRCGMMYVLGDLHIITHRSTGTLLGWGELYLSLDHSVLANCSTSRTLCHQASGGLSGHDRSGYYHPLRSEHIEW